MLIDVAVDTAIVYQLTDADGVPTQADALPTYRVLGAEGPVGTNYSGTAAQAESGTITNATAASPSVITTSPAHGLATGAIVTVASVGGTSGVNGVRSVTVASSTTLSLDGTTGSGAYTSGGTWKTTGLYSLSLADIDESLEAGRTYTLVLSGTISSVKFTRTIPFTVA